MKCFALGSLLAAVALATSGCGGASRPATTGVSRLPTSLRAYIHSTKTTWRDGPINEIDVYGPASRGALVKASSGDLVFDHSKGFYLLVMHGNFVCTWCSSPRGGTTQTGTVETQVWSPKQGGTDAGIEHAVPAGIAKLHRLATIQVN